jgi:multidrug resistance efflux pump
MELARSSMARWEALRKKDAVSQQELDERRSAFAQASSNLAAADANVERLRQVEGSSASWHRSRASSRAATWMWAT